MKGIWGDSMSSKYTAIKSVTDDIYNTLLLNMAPGMPLESVKTLLKYSKSRKKPDSYPCIFVRPGSAKRINGSFDAAIYSLEVYLQVVVKGNDATDYAELCESAAELSCVASDLVLNKNLSEGVDEAIDIVQGVYDFEGATDTGDATRHFCISQLIVTIECDT